MAVNVATNASGRRLVYGANVLLGVLLAVALLGVAVYLGDRYKTQFDWTRGGVNSLSPATRQLLNKLDQNIRVSALHAVLSEYDKPAQKRQDTVKDLLALYESAGRGRVTTSLINPLKEEAKAEALLARLREKPAFRDETKLHAEALLKFPELNQKLMQLLKTESEEFHKLEQADPRLGKVSEFKIIERNLQQGALYGPQVADEIAELQKAKIPRYERAVKALDDYLMKLRALLGDAHGWMTKEAVKMAGATPDVLMFFRNADLRYTPLLQELDGLQKKTQALANKKGRLEELYYEKLVRWAEAPTILVETDADARVLAQGDVWQLRANNDPENASMSPDDDGTDFIGEQAISSALLQLTQKERTAVVFTRFGGEPLLTPNLMRMDPTMPQRPRAPYEELLDALEKANFIVRAAAQPPEGDPAAEPPPLEWDVATQKQPPKAPGASRTIYIVFPPAPPMLPNQFQQMPQPAITPADKKLITDALEQSGMAIFLTGWSEPISRDPSSGPPYEFANYLKTEWGVEVLYRFLTLEFTPSTEAGKQDLRIPARPLPEVLKILTPLLRFTDHPIARPLQALSGAFYIVAPLNIVADETKPAGVTVEPVAELLQTEDVWAFDDIQDVFQEIKRNRGLRPKQPVPLVAAFHDRLKETLDKDLKQLGEFAANAPADGAAAFKELQEALQNLANENEAAAKKARDLTLPEARAHVPRWKPLAKEAGDKIAVAAAKVAAVPELPKEAQTFAQLLPMRYTPLAGELEGLRTQLLTVTPFPVAVAATNAEKKRKIVVFTSKYFAADEIAQQKGGLLTTRGVVPYLFYPANTDLFLNTLHWLTGDADRIAVGPRRADVPRLDKLKEGAQANFWRVFLVGLWPALALLVGGGVWFFRRR